MIPIIDVITTLEAQGLLISSVPERDFAITGISDDSRAVRPGDLYCAILGYSDDGHRYLADAARAGAVAALVEHRNAEIELAQFEVANSRRAAAIAAQLVFSHPAEHLKLVGVTGTNGKTTTALVARHVLERRMPSGALGTLGAVDPSGQWFATGLTTPGPVAFARCLSELKQHGARCVVAEVSSHALAQHRVDGVEFDVGVFTNLSRDHLDYHSDFDDYLAAKSRLAGLVADDGTLVVNVDEPAWKRLPGGRLVLGFGSAPEADYRAVDVNYGPKGGKGGGSRWRLVAPDGEAEVRLPLLGEFNVMNSLAAAAVGGAFGLAVDELAQSLSEAPQVPGRLEVLVEQPLVLRDYAHTPDALRRVLVIARDLTDGRVIVVFGCGGERDRGKRPLMGRAAAEGADYSIVTSDNPRNESSIGIIAEIVRGMAGAQFEEIEDRRLAIERALELAGEGDLVLLAGKGHERYQIVGDEHRPFDEASIVTELLSRGGRKE